MGAGEETAPTGYSPGRGGIPAVLTEAQVRDIVREEIAAAAEEADRTAIQLIRSGLPGLLGATTPGTES